MLTKPRRYANVITFYCREHNPREQENKNLTCRSWIAIRIRHISPLKGSWPRRSEKGIRATNGAERRNHFSIVFSAISHRDIELSYLGATVELLLLVS